MIIFLVAGIACLALCAFQLTRPASGGRPRARTALEAVRSSAATGGGGPSGARRESVLLPRLSALLVRVHMKIWRKESPDDINAQLYRAGASRRLTAEKFMAGRVLFTFLGLLAGFHRSQTARERSCSRLFFGFAGLYLPALLPQEGRDEPRGPHRRRTAELRRSAGDRDRGRDELRRRAQPSHRGARRPARGGDGPDPDRAQDRRVAAGGTAELHRPRRHESLRSPSPTPCSPPTTSDRPSPGSSARRRATCGIAGRCTPRSGLKKRR